MYGAWESEQGHFDASLALLGHISKRDGAHVEGRPRKCGMASGPATGDAWAVQMPGANDRQWDQLLVHAGAREAVLVHVEHEAVVNPAARRPSPRSSDTSAMPYARFTDMWVRPISPRQS
jgi:hypothetical protein